jgi:CheY-like chemotaxis protein
MRIRNFLLVHSSRSIRTMIARLVLAEYGDVEIIQAGNGRDALLSLTKHAFDLVICDTDLEDMPVSEFRLEMMECSTKNKHIEFIAIAGSADELEDLAAAGFKHVMTPPFDPGSLTEKIDQVCDPRKCRQSERFHIPNSKVTINVWGMEAEARMINISRGGVLAEVSGDRSELLLQNNPRLTISVRAPGICHDIKNLPSKLARLNVTRWNRDYKPTTMRVAYIFLALDENSRGELEKVFQLTKETLQDALARTCATAAFSVSPKASGRPLKYWVGRSKCSMPEALPKGGKRRPPRPWPPIPMASSSMAPMPGSCTPG